MIAVAMAANRPASDNRVKDQPELRAALVGFMDAMDAARATGGHQALGRLVVPAIFGSAAGGGLRFSELTAAHLRAQSRLYAELAEVAADEERPITH